LAYDAFRVPPTVQDWGYFTNPIPQSHASSAEWMLPGSTPTDPYWGGLYDPANEDYAAEFAAVAVARMAHLQDSHGAEFEGLWLDSISSGWWYGTLCTQPEGFDLAEFVAAQSSFLGIVKDVANAAGFKLAANANIASLTWPGNLDVVSIEHNTVNSAIPSLVANAERTYPLIVHLEPIDPSLTGAEAWSKHDASRHPHGAIRSIGMQPIVRTLGTRLTLEEQLDELKDKYERIMQVDGDGFIFYGWDAYVDRVIEWAQWK
jgi:hypothetical protein